MKKIKWGILGLGKIANKFASDLLLVEGAMLQGVASRDANKAKDFANTYHSEKYHASYVDLVNDPEIDVVYIATPHVFHFEQTMLCLKAGKSVLCEKPMGMNANEVQEMIAEATKRGLFLMEAIWTRFIPAFEKVLEILNENTLGEIKLVRADFGFVGDPNPAKRIVNKSLGGGSLLDVGIYPVYLSQMALGSPNGIKATARFAPSGIDSYCGMLFEYNNGAQAILDSANDLETPTQGIIHGEKGWLKMHSRFHHPSKLSLKINGQDIQEMQLDYKGFGYFYEIVEVVHCLQNNLTESTKVSHKNSLDLIQTLDGVRKEIGLSYE